MVVGATWVHCCRCWYGASSAVSIGPSLSEEPPWRVGQIRVADWVSFPLPMTAPIDDLARDGIPYVPYFPLGGFNHLQSSILSKVATRLDATPMQVALAWLLRRAHNIVLIPGTSSVAHLRENLTSVELNLPDDAVTTLNGIGSTAPEVNATLPRVG